MSRDINIRLEEFLNSQNLNKNQLAVLLDKANATIGTYVGEKARSKPGFDFLFEILIKFPKLNARWLITGQGPMEWTDDVAELNNKIEIAKQALLKLKS